MSATDPRSDKATDGTTLQDAHRLAAIATRFRDHHAQRLTRAAARLPPRQRLALQALPVLYHRNHPALPGYLGPDVPSGIAGYRPDRDAVAALRRLARGYRPEREPPSRHDLHSVFIMGSGGTTGQGRDSDLDIWVCCDALLHASLWPKVRLIDQWARELGLELHTFLVDPDLLRTRGRLPGSRTPGLVLDEFYRSGALVAGRYPMWWLISSSDPEEYAATAEHLLRRRFVRAADVVDFGPVPVLPPGELANAAIVDLQRALKTPHKSLLKLKLVEAYAEAPLRGTLSSAYKARMHAGVSEPLALDPYLLLYEHLEGYLTAAGRDGELPFIRRLLAAKTAENAELHLGGRNDPPSPLLAKLLAWGFSREELAELPRMDHWPMSRRLAEHRQILAALDTGLALARRLVTASRGSSTGAGSDAELDYQRQLLWLNETSLARLEFVLARLPREGAGYIPVLHPALQSRRQPPRVTFERTAAGWSAFDDEGPVATFTRLVEAAVWAEQSGAELVPARADGRLQRNLAQIRQGFSDHRRAVCVFVNAESARRRLPPSDRDSTHDEPATLLSRQNDPLDYSGFHQLLIDSFDIVSREAAGRWRLESVREEPNLLATLARLLATPPAEVAWHVMGGQERFLIAERLERLHRMASGTLNAPEAVFVLPFGADTVALVKTRHGVEVHRHASIPELKDYLRRMRPRRVGLDPASPRLRGLVDAS